jgi:hypothetical protein
MSGLEETLRDKIIAIIDDGLPFRIARRPYDEPFAEKNGIRLEDITNKRYIPCLSCGEDITPMVLLGRTRSFANVYCSKKCRTAHSLMRLVKIDAKTRINELASGFVARCLDIVMDAPTKRVSKVTKLETAALLLETNALLRDILKELQDGNRPTRASLPLVKK